MSISLIEDATLHPLVLPARADAADAAEFRELSRVRNEVYRELTGRSEQDLTPELDRVVHIVLGGQSARGPAAGEPELGGDDLDLD